MRCFFLRLYSLSSFPLGCKVAKSSSICSFSAPTVLLKAHIMTVDGLPDKEGPCQESFRVAVDTAFTFPFNVVFRLAESNKHSAFSLCYKGIPESHGSKPGTTSNNYSSAEPSKYEGPTMFIVVLWTICFVALCISPFMFVITWGWFFSFFCTRKCFQF